MATSGGFEAWNGHIQQLNDFLVEVKQSQFWMNGASFPEAFKDEMMFPPKVVPHEAFAVVPQGEMGYGVSLVFLYFYFNLHFIHTEILHLQ